MRNAHEVSRWNPLFHERSSMPVDALKKMTGAPEAGGDWRVTRFATDAILRLFSLRKRPRLMRWVKKSFMPEIIIKSPRWRKEVTYCILRLLKHGGYMYALTVTVHVVENEIKTFLQKNSGVRSCHTKRKWECALRYFAKWRWSILLHNLWSLSHKRWFFISSWNAPFQKVEIRNRI